MRYEKDKKQKKDDTGVSRKREIDDKVHMISAKIKRLTDESDHLIESADSKALEAE